MSYIPKNWNDLPSEDTPILADDLDHIENGIENISNVTEYLNGVLGTNADVYVNIGNTLASGMIIHIIFPTIASTSDLTFSIDNGTTKKNVQCSGVNVIGTYVSGKSLDLTYDGTYWQISDICSLESRLTTAEGEIDTAQSDINNAEAVIGNETDTYSASSTYALGSLVIYNNLLYKCTTAITVAEAWTIAHWTQVSLTSLAQSGCILFNTGNPKAGTITLSDSAANYEYFEIYYLSSDDYYGSVKIQSPNNKDVPLNMFIAITTNGYIDTRNSVITISGTTISKKGTQKSP